MPAGERRHLAGRGDHQHPHAKPAAGGADKSGQADMRGTAMNRTIPDVMRYDWFSQHHFHSMPHDQQRQAIQRLGAAGHTDDVISRATGVSVDQVRRLLGGREAQR